ncbi:unnamed protein product [Psylliodes chrysocephalus]|uniref:GST C-terminal domain-containing protein n=1 Tax=Psylliodes chrysocephalus TaxID=3402493 RepID=A0A9P0DA09_9CUCU|nr:unnamed protein product [Psylliodes chrysocephala]
MVVNIQKNLNQIASLLKIKLDDAKINKIPNSGVTNKVFQLVSAPNSSLGPKNQMEILEVQQWIEYINVYVVHVDSPQNARIVLKELNEILAEKTYLVGFRLTIADILLFYTLKKVMRSLSGLDKENYLNLCRWFDNLQHDALIRPNNEVIDFSSNYLAALVPARH